MQNDSYNYIIGMLDGRQFINNFVAVCADEYFSEVFL